MAPIEFYSWRVEHIEDGIVHYISPFDPMTDEFDLFSIEFGDPEVAARWCTEYFDGPIPDDYRLIKFTGTLVVPQPQGNHS